MADDTHTRWLVSSRQLSAVNPPCMALPCCPPFAQGGLWRAATAESLRRIFPGQKIVFVTGVMADKDVEHILGLIVPLAKRFYTVTPNNPRAMQAGVLAQRIQAMGVEALPCDSIPQAVQSAMDFAGKDGVACALGSLYMSGDIRSCFQ